MAVGIGTTQIFNMDITPNIIYQQLQNNNYYYINPTINADSAITTVLHKMNGKPGTIILPDSTVTITKQIVLKDSQWLQGAGNRTILNYAGKMTNSGSAILISGTHCGIKNISLNSSFGKLDRGFFGINVDGNDPRVATDPLYSRTYRFVIDNCDVRNFDVGINLNRTFIGTISNCYAYYNGVGIKFSESFVNAVYVLGGEYGANGIGIHFKGNVFQLKNTISTTIEGNGVGIQIESPATSTTIRDCYFEENTAGSIVINHSYCYSTIINGNYFRKDNPSITILKGNDTFISENACNSSQPFFIDIGANNTVINRNNLRTRFGVIDPHFDLYNKSSTTTIIS